MVPLEPQPQTPSPGPRDGNPDAPMYPTSPTPSGAPPTKTSTTGSRPSAKVDPAAVAATIAGALALVAGGAAWILSKRRLHLRPPTEHECGDVAEPLARIVSRHSDAAWLTADLADGLDAAVAAVAYGQTRPVSRGLPVQQATPMPEGIDPL